MTTKVRVEHLGPALHNVKILQADAHGVPVPFPPVILESGKAVEINVWHDHQLIVMEVPKI